MSDPTNIFENLTQDGNIHPLCRNEKEIMICSDQKLCYPKTYGLFGHF